MFLPLVILFYNKGYLSTNRYLAGFLFFAALYVLENFYFFFGKSLNIVAFFTNTHAFFYLIGPCAFFYVRSILRDNSVLNKIDYLHFALFAISFVGYVPYFFSSWDYKLEIAQNLQGENWDISPFHLNSILLHEVDQVLNVLHTYFYSISLWYLLWHYKKKTNNPIIHNSQYKLMRNWLVTFASILTIITLNFTIAMAGIWLYDEKSLFLERTEIALLFASVIYIGMNMTIMFFPNIMYGLPVIKQYPPANATFSSASLSTIDSAYSGTFFTSEKKILDLFSFEYIGKIEAMLQEFIALQLYLEVDCSLSQISDKLQIPAHHLTYYFNGIREVSFSDWRNNLRIDYARELLGQGEANNLTLVAISAKCGFASQSTFIRAFKNVTGTTPSAYLKTIS
jgi:AraC-like DNA-binding protein